MTGEAPPPGQAWLDAETRVGEAPHEHGDDLRLWLRLLTCSTLVENEVRRRLRDEFGTTLPRFDLMAQLERAPDGMVIGDLSKRMMVSPGNMTDLVDRMVDAGHLVRSSPPNDRRVQIIALTPEGHAFFRRMADRHSVWIGEFFAGLPSPAIASLTQELGTLKQSIRSALAAKG
ncbi:MAG: MarR family transcriptional regulator [Mesorhizobium amorphae]|nr:MAG: MarR family transcriptional regulator [Mesorhizobium amorphae]